MGSGFRTIIHYLLSCFQLFFFQEKKNAYIEVLLHESISFRWWKILACFNTWHKTHQKCNEKTVIKSYVYKVGSSITEASIFPEYKFITFHLPLVNYMSETLSNRATKWKLEKFRVLLNLFFFSFRWSSFSFAYWLWLYLYIDNVYMGI